MVVSMFLGLFEEREVMNFSPFLQKIKTQIVTDTIAGLLLLSTSVGLDFCKFSVVIWKSAQTTTSEANEVHST